MPSISERLREVREALRMSQFELAAHCGITARTQRNYESGVRTPVASYLAAIADAGGDVLYILTGKGVGGSKPVPALTAEEEVVLEYFREAPKDVRIAVLGALQAGKLPPNSTSDARKQVIHGRVGAVIHVHGDLHQAGMKFFSGKHKA